MDEQLKKDIKIIKRLVIFIAIVAFLYFIPQVIGFVRGAKVGYEVAQQQKSLEYNSNP